MSGKAKIQIRGLHKAFGRKKILRGVDLDVMPGESHIVIGLSGTGKSVLLKCILGLIRPDAGEILVNGEDWCMLHEEEILQRMQCIGMVFQGSALFDSLPVWENVAFVLLRRGMSRAEARDRADEVLDWVGMPGVGDKMPAELSGGMAKRAGLARAICHKPDIVLYDEPLAGLDPVMSDVITSLMKRLHQTSQVTSLTIAHNMTLVRRFADRVSMLYEGKIYRQLGVDELDSVQDPLLRQFIEGRAEGPIRLRQDEEA